MSDPRFEAAMLLTKIEKDASYSNLSLNDLLKKVSFDDSRDLSFFVSLVYGVLERKLILDYNISIYVSSLKKIKSKVLNIMRVGAYQILFTDKIPVSAAVNEAVKSVKKCGAQYASGLTNAVLRKIADNGVKYPSSDNEAEYLSTHFSVDKSIIEQMLNDYGKKTVEKIFNSYWGRRPIYIRCNTLKIDVEQLAQKLSSEGVEVKKTYVDNCLAIENSGDISGLSAYKDGLFYVQDMSSQLCAELLDVKPGYTVVDCCAAPGGKSFTIAQHLQNAGTLYSCDIYKHKTELIEKNAFRLGINNIKTICSDARKLNALSIEADAVLCDVPCSGFGVIGRKPEIRYKSVREVSSLPQLQKEILYSCASLVKKGGVLVYSTCTLNKAENDYVCDAFLEDFPEFRISDDKRYMSLTDKYLTVFPDENSGDGFFIAKFIKG